MLTYSLSCRKHTDNIRSEKVRMVNKVVWEKSRCTNCMVDKNIKRKVVATILILNYLYSNKTCWNIL